MLQVQPKKKKKKLSKTVRVNFFITLNINQKLETTWEAFLQEEELRLDKTNEICGIFNFPECHSQQESVTHTQGKKQPI